MGCSKQQDVSSIGCLQELIFTNSVIYPRQIQPFGTPLVKESLTVLNMQFQLLHPSLSLSFGFGFKLKSSIFNTQNMNTKVLAALYLFKIEYFTHTLISTFQFDLEEIHIKNTFRN